MKVVLAEKPSVARDLARILGAKSGQAGYFEGNGYQVTWAVGHLVELADTKDYGYPHWSMSNLPIIPREFLTRVTRDNGRSRQYKVIEDLFKSADEIICATDAGREGELIFRYIYLQAGVDKPIQRLWISSQTDKAIKEGFAKLKPGTDYENLYLAAKCRSEADWLVGINATQAYTLKYGDQPPFKSATRTNRQPLSLGRVQTPVLKLLVDRYLEAKNFKSETYWEIHLKLSKDDKSFVAKWFTPEADRFTKKEEAQAIFETLTDKATVAETNQKPKKENPPLLYDLTELQKDANKRYNFSAQRTLDLAQELYERFKTITYPRTDSRYLSEDIFPTIPDLLQNVARIGSYAGFVQQIRQTGLQMDKRFFNNEKVSDHHAIIPTETDPTSVNMPKEHFMIYDLIVRRMLGAFMGICHKELSEIVLDNAGQNFRAKGTMIREAGWRAVYQALDEALEKRKAQSKGKKAAAKEEEEELPLVDVGSVLDVEEKTMPQKKTKAPAIHTESSILAMMETAGKDMEDEELREAMKDRGLGTPATRAGMIERLLQRGYIERDKKKLIPTERGIALIALVNDRPIASPELTGEWESRLNQMAKGQYDATQFMREVGLYTTQIVREISNWRPSPKAMPAYDLNGLTCPKCKQGTLLKGRRAFGCGRYKEGCDFTLKPLIAGKMVEKEHLTELVQTGSTSQFVQGFTSRAGKRFDARLRLNADFGVDFFFDKVAEPPLKG